MTRFSSVPVRAASAKLTLTAVRALIVLGAYHNKQNGAWPSLKTIALRAGVDRRKIPGAVAELEAAGFVKRTRRWADDGDYTSTLYELVYEDWPQLPKQEAGGPPVDGSGGTATDDAVTPPEGPPRDPPTRAQTPQTPEADQGNTPGVSEDADATLGFLRGLLDDD